MPRHAGIRKYPYQLPPTRITDHQNSFLEAMVEVMGERPAEALRTVIAAGIISMRKTRPDVAARHDEKLRRIRHAQKEER